MNDLIVDLVEKECPYGLYNVCYCNDATVKDCLLCHRSCMIEARRKYLDFYKKVFIPWNNERKDGKDNGYC